MGIRVVGASVLQGASGDLAFPVPSPLSDRDICPCHPEPLIRRNMPPRHAEEHVRCRIFETQVRAIRLRFRLSVVERGRKCWVCYAMGVVEVLLIIDSEPVCQIMLPSPRVPTFKLTVQRSRKTRYRGHPGPVQNGDWQMPGLEEGQNLTALEAQACISSERPQLEAGLSD